MSDSAAVSDPPPPGVPLHAATTTAIEDSGRIQVVASESATGASSAAAATIPPSRRAYVSWRNREHAANLRADLHCVISMFEAFLENSERASDGQHGTHPHMARHWQVCRHSIMTLASLLEFKQTQPLHYVFTGRRKGDERNRSTDGHATIAFSIARVTKNVLRSFVVNRRRFMPAELTDSLNRAIDCVQRTYFD